MTMMRTNVAWVLGLLLVGGCSSESEDLEREFRDEEDGVRVGYEACSINWDYRREMLASLSVLTVDGGVSIEGFSVVQSRGGAPEVESRHFFTLEGELNRVNDFTGTVTPLQQQPVNIATDRGGGVPFWYAQTSSTPADTRISGSLTALFGADPADYDWRNCRVQLYPQKYLPGTDDLLWQHDGGQVRYSRMHQGGFRADVDIDDPVSGNAWTLRGVGDVDGDGTEDVIWQSVGGQVHYWRMLLGERLEGIDIDRPVTGDHWHLRAVGDIDGDGTDDIIWRDRTGLVHYWKMSNGGRQEGIDIGRPSGLPATLIAAGDVDGNGTDDLVWQDIDGQVFYWQMQEGRRVAVYDIAEAVPEGMASLRGVGDVDGDGTEDLVWEGYGGDVFAWLLDGGDRIATLPIEMPSRGPGWRLVGVGDVF